MKKSNRFKMLMAGLATAALLTAALPVSAAESHKQGKLTYQNIKVSFNGPVVSLKDSDGNQIEPFNYNGSIYLPVRGVSQALGLTVEYDEASHTVKITGTVTAPSRPEGTPPTDSSSSSGSTSTDSKAAGGHMGQKPSGDASSSTTTGGTPPAPPSGGTAPTDGTAPAGDKTKGTPPSDMTPPDQQSSTASSTPVEKDASLTFNDLKVTLNGAAVSLQDSDGNTVEPFIYDGSMYLPIRAISQALGLSVSYDDTRHLVKLSLGDAPAEGDGTGGPGGQGAGGPGGAAPGGTTTTTK